MSEVNINITPIEETVNVNISPINEVVNVAVTEVNEVVNIEVSEIGAPAELTLNGNAFIDAASGETTDITLQDTDENPVTPVSVVGSVITVNVGGGEVVIERSDNTVIATVTAPDTYEVADSTAVIKDSANNTLKSENILAASSENITINDTVVQLKDTAGNNIGSPNSYLAESSNNLTAPNATVNLNGGAFLTPRSNQTINITTVDQNSNVLTPTVTGTQLQFTIDYNTLIRFQLEAGQTDSVLYTVVNNVNNGSYTATTNDGSSGTITFSKNGGAFAAFSSPLVLAAGDTIRVRRTTATAQGFVQITGTY